MSLIEDMTSQNPWWASGRLDLGNSIERDVFGTLISELEERAISAIIGIRRSGKTTVMKHMISWLLENGIEGKNILYFSLDLPRHRPEEVLRTYYHEILGKFPSEVKTYIFLDEVQNFPEWSSVLKSYYDRGYPIKFVVSGSSSFNILKGSGESLVGRIRIHRMEPFSFREFLRYRGLEAGDVKGVPAEHGRLLVEFRHYMKMGGFPESYGKDAVEYFSTMSELIFYRDLINILDIKRPRLLKDIFYSILEQSGNTVNYANISRDTGAKYETVLSYLDYLEMAFLISRSPLFPGKSRQKRKSHKIYASEHSFLKLIDVPEGRVMETLVFNHLRRTHRLMYWHNSGEVDIILEDKKGLVPVEISVSQEKNPRHILYFMEKFGIKKGYILSMDEMEERRFGHMELVTLPAYLFLLRNP